MKTGYAIVKRTLANNAAAEKEEYIMDGADILFFNAHVMAIKYARKSNYEVYKNADDPNVCVAYHTRKVRV